MIDVRKMATLSAPFTTGWNQAQRFEFDATV